MNKTRKYGWRASCLIGGIAALGLIVIGLTVTQGGPLDLDRQIMLALRQANDLSTPVGSPHFAGMVRDVTALGSVIVLTIFVLIAITCLAAASDYRGAAAVLGLIGGGQIVASTIKNLFERARPDIVPPLALETSWSFPSGHATMSMIAYLTFAAVLARCFETRFQRVLLYAAAVLLSLMIGASRLYIGVHWPTDVLAGWLLGLGWFLFWQPVTRRLLGDSRA